MPLAWLAFSIIYLLFALSIEPRRMPADREGWDPGSNAIPVGIGYVMVAVSAYLVVTDRRKPAKAAPAAEETVGKGAGGRKDTGHRESAAQPPATAQSPPVGEVPDVKALILLTIATTVLYIMVFRVAGFVVSTTVLMLTLTYFYLRQRVRLAYLGEYLRSLGGALVTNVLLYSLGRWIIRWTQYFGRTWGVELLRNRLFTALLALAAWAVIVAPIYLVIRRRRLWTDSTGTRAALAACITTLGLYLVFQQIFRVALPGGFIAW